MEHSTENGHSNGTGHSFQSDESLEIEDENPVQNNPLLVVNPPEQLEIHEAEGIVNPVYADYDLDNDEDESSSSSLEILDGSVAILARNGDHHQPEKQHKSIPVYIVEDHHHVVQFIHENIRRKFLPIEGNTLIHFDSHPDMLIPKRMPADSAYEPRELYEHHDIENWIMPNCYTGIFKELVWVKPPWSNQIRTKRQKLYVGKCKSTHTIRLESRENYFISEGLFQLQSQLENVRTINLDCLTLGNRIIDLADDIGQMKCISENNDKNPTVLDIDLDFFSTKNPFLTTYEEADLYNLLRNVFRFTPPLSDCANHIVEAQHKRLKQLEELEELFKYLKEFRKMPEFQGAEPSQIYKEVMTILYAVSQHYPDTEVDWDLIFSAGCTIDDHELPHHVSTNEEIEILMKSFENFLETFMQPPLIITISRSSNDDYTPRDQVEYIQGKVLEILNRRFNCDEPVIAYTESPEVEQEPSPTSSAESTLSTTSLTSDESMKETIDRFSVSEMTSNVPTTEEFNFSDPQPGPSHK